MSLLRLSLSKYCLTRNNILQKCERLMTCHCLRTFASEKSLKTEDDDDDKPIQYSTSNAATWLVKHSQKGNKDEEPWFQPISVSLSVISFLVYFCILRESNDIDEILEKELGDHFQHINTEKIQEPATTPFEITRK